MARPRKARTLEKLPEPAIYIPAGWTKAQTSPVEVAIEDFEIMRLVDGHGYRIEEAAKKVGVSRSTAGRMVERARRAISLGLEQRSPIYIDASKDLVLDPSVMQRSSDTNDGRAGHMAIACAEDSIESPVERIFGRSPQFRIVAHSDSCEHKLIKNPGMGVQRDAALVAVQTLQSHGVSRVVAGRFGPEALKALAEANIQALTGNGLKIRQAIELFQPRQT